MHSAENVVFLPEFNRDGPEGDQAENVDFNEESLWSSNLKELLWTFEISRFGGGEL